MRRIVIITFIMCAFIPAFTQNDLIDRIANQAVEIDSLKRVVKAEIDSKQQLWEENYGLQDTLKKLISELKDWEEFNNEKRNMDTLLRQKTDSIALLKNTISEKDKQNAVDKQIYVQKAGEEYDKGKIEILSTIINCYIDKSFDELLKCSTKQSAQRDSRIIENAPEVKQILSDIENYFSAKELLDAKLDAVQITNHQIQLGKITRESEFLSKLKESIDHYQTFTSGLKVVVENIVVLDNTEAVSGMSKDIQRKKFDKILAEFSSYIFNYDFNFSDYPYLADVILEIIKRKKPNADADISDLLKKL